MPSTKACQGAAVEGEKVGLQTRQFEPFPPKSLNGTRKYPFKMRIQSYAQITDPYVDPPAEMEYSTSMVEVGDKINGAVISGWSRKPPGPPNVEKGSASHSANFLTIKGGCYASVDTPAREHLNDPEFCRLNPPIKQERLNR